MVRLFLVIVLVCVQSVAYSGYKSPKVELREAIIAGDANKINQLVETGLDKRLIKSHLHYAIGLNYKHDHVEVIKALINHGADVNQLSGTGISTLVQAVRISDFKLIQLLVEKGADLSVRQRDKNILQLAVQIYYSGPEEHLKKVLLSRLKIVQYLIDLNVFKLDAELLLHTVNGSRDPAITGVLQLLIKNGLDIKASVNAPISDNMNPFFIAARSGYLETVRLFVKHGVSPAIRGESGKTAVTYALFNNKKDVVLYLLNNPKLFSQQQLKHVTQTALDANINEVSSLLISYGVNPGPAYVCDDCVFQSGSFPGEGIPVFIANKNELTLFIEPALNQKKVRLSVAAGKRLAHSRAVYRTLKSAKVRALKNVPQFPCGQNGMELRQGEIIEYLQYRAEGYLIVRAKGIVCEVMLNNDQFEFIDKAPVTELWVLFTDNQQKRLGWYLLSAGQDDIKFGDREF